MQNPIIYMLFGKRMTVMIRADDGSFIELVDFNKLAKFDYFRMK